MRALGFPYKNWLSFIIDGNQKDSDYFLGVFYHRAPKVWSKYHMRPMLHPKYPDNYCPPQATIQNSPGQELTLFQMAAQIATKSQWGISNATALGQYELNQQKQLIIIFIEQTMIRPVQIIALLSLLALTLAITGVGLNPIRPLQSNQGISTKYMFYINPETSIAANAQIQITFPAEFDKTAIASQLNCLASTPSYSWKSVPCIYSSQSVLITLGTINNEQHNILVAQMTNPSIYSMSSYFSVCLMVANMSTSCSKTFGKVVFPGNPVTTSSTNIYPLVTSLNTLVVGQSSTYQIQFSLSSNYTTGNTIRITFPVGFQTSSTPICQMNGTYNQVITTFVWPDQRSIECQNINKTLGPGESLKIIGIFNPSFAGTYGNTPNGFKLELLQGTTTIVMEQISIQNTVSIIAGTLTGYISQANNFIEGDVTYTFYLNILNSLTASNFILISFDNSWILYNSQCSVISGITLSPGYKLNCTNSTGGGFTVLNVSNFLSASVSNQLVFSILVRSPVTPGTYTVSITTANINGTVDSMSTTVYLNGTYGDYSMLSIDAIVAQSNVPVSGTGPLELTFFLNYPLPQTNVLTYGKFIVYIYPQIPLPPPLINGVLKCYFFNTIPAQTCIWDTTTSATYTKLTINTPLTSAYQYSQIPITITTEGAVSTAKIGITIADIVTRYRFELQAYTQANSTCPTEVYFTEYIAAPVYFPITYYALTKEVNEGTHLRFEFASPYNFTSPLTDDLRIKIEFLAGGAWAPNLGYAANTIYKRFPCVYSDNKLQTLPPEYNSQVSCDLYTYLTGPHASLTNSSSRGPYIIVSGFTAQMYYNTQVRLQLGKFLIGSSTNLAAYIRFSLVQQTPTMLTKYVELYYNEFVAFTTTTQSIPTAGTGVITDVITNAQINVVSNHRMTYTAPATFFAVIYSFDQISTPSFTNQFVECTIGTSPNINWCTMLGYPSNYIVEYSHLGTFPTAVSSTVNFTNGVYSGTFFATAQLYNSASITIYKQKFNVVYTPYAITGGNYGFWMDTTEMSYLYKGSQTYFYVDHYPTQGTPDNGFIRLIFANGIQLGQNSYCNSAQLVPYVTEVGIICTIQSSTSLKISNIQGLGTLAFYRIRVRLSTLLTTSSSVSPTVTIQCHYSVTADPSIVNSVNNVPLNPGQTNYYTAPNKFAIANPRVAFEMPRVGYVGKFQTIFNPTSDVLTAYQIKLILNNHAWNGGYWTTPNNVVSDPLVCLINYIRVPCTYTLSPFTVIMNVSPAGITNNQNNIITLDTEYLITYNGIKHPSQGGHYNCYLQYLTNTGTIIQQQSFYHRVLPPKLGNFYVNSTCNDVAVENMFYFRFQIGSQAVNSNIDGTTYSRIYIQFPTIDDNNQTLFANNLGGYTKTGEYVGCAFDTWDSYYIGAATGRVMCRLIMSQVPGEPVKVEIVNHGGFSGSWSNMQLWMAKIFNPAVAVTSLPISIKIDHVVVATNDIYELYYDTFDVFMNSQTAAPTYSVVEDCSSGAYCYGSCVILNSDVYQRNWFRFSPYIAGSPDPTLGYYYVIDTTVALQPNSLQYEYPYNYCHGSYYNWCLAFPDINYYIISVNNANRYFVELYLTAGNAISQITTNLVAKMWYNQRYLGTHTIQFSWGCWVQLQGALSSIGIGSIASNAYDSYINRRRVEIQVSFTTQYYLPSTGSILINFPSGVPRIYPHCRSMNNLGSTLFAQGTSQNGEIGCLVQNTHQWVITGFNALGGGSAIVIVGFIDLPNYAGYIGTGEIITFNNTHATNIRSSGFIIDYWTGTFGPYTNNAPSQNMDGQIMMEETLPLRTNYVGPLRFKFTLASNLNGPNAGVITVRLPQVSTLNLAGGFSYVSSKKHVCQIIQVATFEETGCIITDITADSNALFPNFVFTMITSSTLVAGTLYKMVISTATGSQPQGLTFPTTAGTYKIDFNYDTTGSTGLAIHNNLYLEVYGTKFSYLNVKAFCTCPGNKNIIWIQLTPTTTIQTTQQLVIEVPTVSASGSPLFDYNLGLSGSDGQSIPYDVMNTQFTESFMTCRLFWGDQTNSRPAKIVCGNFQSAITSGQILWFAIAIKNPSSIPGSQVSIPFFIYSQEQGTTYRTNFDVIQNAVFLRTDVNSYSDVIWIQSAGVQTQTPGTYIDMISRNNWGVGAGDYLVILFNFPIRVNGKVTGGCTYPGTATVYGDAYYHQNLWLIICAVTTTAVSTSGAGYTTRNLRISGFYTPFYYLSSTEQSMTVYTYMFSSKITGICTISDGYPNETPKSSASTSLTLTPIHQTATQYAGSRDDYTITFTYSSSATVDLSFTQMIAFIFPTSIDYSFPESDCVESPSSQVEIASCYIDTTQGVVWITPVVKSTYTSNMAVSITTRNLAIRNPVTNINLNNNYFVVKYYSWQNMSKPGLSPLSNDYYCFLKIDNFPSSAISYSYNPSPYQVPSFSYIKYPHQKYYQDTPFSSLIHRAPFQMEFLPTVTFSLQSGSNYNMIKIVYPSSFSDASMVKIRDLQVFRPVCYLNNQRIKNCVIDITNHAMTMSFLFGLTANTKYHLKFSILDSRNADIDGFLANTPVSSLVLMYKPYNAGNWYYTETDQFPSLFSLPTGASAGPFRGIVAGTPDYGHTVASQLNYVNLLLGFNRTDITGLVFEIPSVDKNGNAIFSSQAALTATFHGQSNGGSYPCGNHGYNAGGAVRCILLLGDYSNLGTVTRIIMTDFTYQTKMNCRFTFLNPDNINTYFSVTVRAFGGPPSALNPYGTQYMGSWEFNEIFMVQTTTVSYSTTYTTNYYKCPSLSPWRNNTDIFVVSRDQQIGGLRTSIATIKLYDSSSGMNDKQFCEATLGSTNFYDDLLQYTLVSGGVTTKYAFFIRTWQSTTNNSYTTWNGWGLSYLKCKYYTGLDVTASFFYGDTSIQVAIQSFSNTYCNSWTGVTKPASKYLSESYFVTDGTNTHLVHEFDLTPSLSSVTNFGFRNGDAMVLSIAYQNSPWGTISSCSLLGGVSSTSLNQRAYCNVGSSNNLYIVNIGGFVADPLLASSTGYRIKLKFVSSVTSATSDNNNFYFYVALYANYDAYSHSYQAIINEYNNLISVSSPCYYPNPNVCYINQASGELGSFQVQALTDTFMRVAYSTGPFLDFTTQTGYGHHFMISLNGFDFGPSCTVSNVVYEFSASSTPGSGTNNTAPLTTASCTASYLYLVFNGLTFANYWGGNGAANTGTWTSGQYIIFYITISPDPTNRDLPSLHHEYLFIQGTYNYLWSGSYHSCVQKTVTFAPQTLASSATLSTLSTNVAGTTELSFQITSSNIDFGPQNTGYVLLAQFKGTGSWTGSSDPFGTYTNTAILDDNLACKCIAGASPLTVSAASPIVDTSCTRRMPNGTFSNYAILINANVLKTQDLICFFPEFKVPASTSFSVQFKVIYGDSFPPELTAGTTTYSSLYRITSNTLTFGTTPTMTITAFNSQTESPNFYASATNVGSTYSGIYTLSGAWSSGLNSPYLYINFLSAGPIPVYSFCSNLNIFLQCRVYTNYLYLVVAQLKSTSATSFSFSNSGTSLQYPPSQTNLANYGANIYVGVGSWQYKTSISRTQSSLTPISTSGIFNAYSDKYGSGRVAYQTNLFFSFNPSGQYLYNNFQTGSQLVISWTGLTTTTNCQVWVQNEPLVNLICATSSSSLVITSPYFDYSTTNNIIVSIGLTNPNSASTTFNANLYSYYSGSRYSLTISTSTTYLTDTSYTSYSPILKSTISLYPFHARISTVANAPLRIRFVLPSSSMATTWGQLVLTYSQIQYTSAHLCYIIMYSSYKAMMQQTERTLYKADSCSSTSSTITVVPPSTLTLTTSTYYELVLMPLGINTAGCTAYGCATQSGYQQTNFDLVNFIAYNNYNSPSIISQQVNKVYNYEGSSYIGLQQIYVLCTQPTITSLYLSININFTSSYNFPSHYLEITLYDLTITAFSGYSIGSIFNCQLSSNFLNVSARQAPQCRVVSADLLNTFVTIRIENIGSLSPQTYWVSLDDITLPTPTGSDKNDKFDIAIAYYGPNNLKYFNYFPQIFQIDNTNQTTPVTSTPFTFNNPALTGFGNQIVGQVAFNWPFDTTSSGYESKIAINFKGGYAGTWSNINSVTFVDETGTYQLLWVNVKLNKFVFLIPHKANSASTTMNITSLTNPYPYQKSLYNFNSTNIIINFYSNYFLANSQTFAQPSFSIFTMNPSLVYINQNLPCNTIDYYPTTNTFAPGSLNVLLLSVEFDETASNILARNLGNIQVKFTSGVSFIRECRAMRNSSLYINTMQVCQPYSDGTNWYVKLYDVANSQLSTGWWIQIFATFNSATLAYTSYVMASNNLVTEYQSSYTITMSGYNSTRTIPTKLSWLNNKYVANFYENQYKFLQAISGQVTPYLKFRFTAPITSSVYSDVYYIYLADNVGGRAFTPVTSGSNVVAQFLPAMSAGDRDFSIGCFAQCTMINSGSIYYYACYMRIGGLTGGADYLIQLSEYNTATSSFHMPTSPGRQQVQFMYNYYPADTTYHNWQYFESITIYHYRFFRFAQFLHTTTTVGDYETITINYTPYGSLSAYSGNNEIALRLSVETRYHAADGGITAVYTADNMNIISGSQYSGVVSNPNTGEINTIQFGQYSVENAPLRFVLAKQSAYADNTQYYWIVPLLQNPGTAYISLRYNLTLVNSPASGYEYIFNHYESINEYYTVSSTSTIFTTSINNNVRAVQTVSGVDLSVNLGSYSLSQWDTAIFKIDNSQAALLPSIANPNDTSNYNYYYFSIINMIMAQKKSLNTITTIGIGSSSSSINYQSTFGLSWVKVFNNSNTPQTTNPFTVYYSNPPALTLTYLTTYAASSVTLMEGFQSQGSAAMYKVTFTTPIIPDGGEVRILFNNNYFTSYNNGSCRVNTNYAKSPNLYNPLRCYRVSQGFRISGFSALAASTSVSAYFMLKSVAAATSSPIKIDVFGQYLNNATRISLAQVGTVTHTSGTVPSALYRFQQTVTPYFSTIHGSNFYMIQGVFNLRLTTLLNGDYIYISEPGWSVSGGNRRMLIKQNSTTVTGWTELFGYYVSTNYYRFALPTNYLMTQSATVSIDYLFRYNVYNINPNGFISGGTGVSRFWITTVHSGVVQEVGYSDFIPYPQPFVLNINNRYTAAGKQTVLDLSWSSNIDISSGQTLVVSFDTHNLLNQMFANDLEGVGANGATYRYLDCREWYNNNEISNSRITCLLNFGNNLANPPIPANLSIVFTNNNYGYTNSRTIRILIANVMNPTTVGLNTGVKVDLMVPCYNQQNQPCSGYEARRSYVTSSSTENLQASATSFTSSSSLVLTTGLTHTFTLILTASIGTSDAIYIVYPENFQGVMPSDCVVSNYYCYVFPTRRWVVLYPTTTIAAGSITLSVTSMNNPYYSQPYSLYFLVTVARSAEGVLGDTYKILQNPITPVSYSLQSSVNATALTVATTQTPNMYLRNYANTVVFTIANLFSDSRTQAIYIQAPSDVTSWDPTYCNASITTTQSFNYPLRFTCIVDPNTPQYIRLTLDTDMPTYNTAWGLMNIVLHAKFTLADFPPLTPTLYVTQAITSGSFYAYSSTNVTTSSSLYYMSKCSVTVSISPNQVPVISVINFNTQSFANRQAKVNNKQVFYMLFKPLVDIVIGSIVFTIPSQFNYPGVFQFDNCLMIGRTTIPQPNCQLSRSQGQTLVTLVPSNYDNQVKIIQIGTVSQTNWFTAPSLPGDFYNMNVAIYSPTGSLIAKQTRNISPVYGSSFNIPTMTIQNVQDANSKLAVYDISFVTGDLQIPPGALTTATTQTSALVFIFQNFNGMNPTDVFANDLKTGLSTGQQVGCKIFSGLTALSGMRIKCILTLGTNSTMKPTISIINYNFINPTTTIVVGFAGIQSLPAVLVNTISIGVVIYYNDIGSKTYLYIPTPIITVPTNSTNMFNSMPTGWVNGWAVNASFTGTNIVLQPTVFTVTFTIPYWYWTDPTYGSWLYNYAYSSTGANDQFILMTFYPYTLLDKNNPTPVACLSCTGVDVYYASGTVRFRHTTTTSSSNTGSFQFTSFPTSAYSMLNQTVYVYYQVFQSYQAVYQKNLTVNLSRTVQKCTKFNFGVVSVSSLNGGQIGVTYLFSIKTNHFVPANGAISITIPSVYGDMVANAATCSLIGFQNTNAYCMINTPYRVDIYPNGTELSSSTTYSIKITGLQNPNVGSSSFVFIVTSYYVSNIYLGLKICENQIIPPAINIKPLRTCTLSWTPQYYNQNFNTSYVFQLSCSDVFRGDSMLYISLPSAYSANNKLGSYPCSSYESTTLIAPTCTLQNINSVLTLTTSIDASSQSSLSLILNLVNPINNTYTASAYVNSKGTQYASSVNSSITILSNSYSSASTSDVQLINTPKQAGLMSTYVFKISPISTFSPSNLGISFPSNFYIDSTQISVSIFLNAQNNIFSLLTYNNIQSLINNASTLAGTSVSSYPAFSVIGTSVYLTNITGQVNPKLWTYVFISNIQNPSSYVYANFTVAYYLISNGFQALQWAYRYPLTYYISSPPKYISMNSVTVSDYDILYPTNYTFNISGANGTYIGISGRSLSYIIVIPTFYKNTLWANTPPVCQFSVLNVPSNCSSSQGEIIVNQAFSTNYSTLSLTISPLLNPSLPTSCNTTDTSILAQTFFIIRIIDTVSNNFLFESASVVDSTNCLTFTAIRIPISLEYSLVMTAGLAYNITYGLTKPASNLKIKAYVSNSAFTFSPPTIDFNDYYTLTKSTQLFLRSDIAPGSYVIYFNKSQSSTQTYFRNILPVTITVTASNNSALSTTPTISIPSLVDSTIGYPVTIPIQFSLPSSTEMTLFMTITQESNQTLAQYSQYLSNFTLTPRIINIMAQQTLYNYTITQGSQLVPPPLTLNFKLTSNYPIVHKLTTPTMYLCFDRDPRYNVLYPPLRITVTQFLTSCNLQDIGKTVTNIYISNDTAQSSAGSVTPKIISLNVSSVASTGATLLINSISAGTIYYACTPAGNSPITNPLLLVAGNISQGITGSAPSEALNVQSGKTAQINFVAKASITSLSQSSNYVFYAVCQNNLGTSSILSVNFSTTTISNGVQFKMYYTAVVENLLLVTSLVQSLRVSPGRIKILTSTYSLQLQANSTTNSNNRPIFTYDIVLAPDEANDVIAPLTTIQSFANSNSALASFQKSIPAFIISTPITYFELRPVAPQINRLPVTNQINNYNASFKVSFLTQSNVYSILIENVGAAQKNFQVSKAQINPVKVSTLNSTQRSVAPSSSQIKAGTDSHNNPLGKYKVVQITTNSDGNGQIVFSDLKEKSSYQVYITASSPLPYEPTMLWPDSNVLTFNFSTIPNPNVGDSSKQLEYITQLQEIDAKLAAGMKAYLTSRASKTNTQNKK